MNVEFKSITISTESDVEQKFIYPLLTTPQPFGLGYSEEDIHTKENIKKVKSIKEQNKKSTTQITL